MSAFQHILKKIESHLSPVAANVLRAIVAVAQEPTAERPIVSADQARTLAQIEKLEGKPPSDATARKRLQLINDAAREAAEAGAVALAVYSRAPNFILEVDEAALRAFDNAAKDESTMGAVIASTREDVAAAPADLMQEPRVLQSYQVFVSHAWEDSDVESILDKFVEKLTAKLKSPGRWAAQLGSIALWFDRLNMHATAPFAGQTDPACSASQFAIFMLSDRFEHSEACRREAERFCTKGAPDRDRVLRIQLSGERRETAYSRKDDPVLPEAWSRRSGKAFRNLLEIYGKDGDAALQDAFADKVRDEICGALLRQSGGPPSPPPGGRARAGEKPRQAGVGALAFANKAEFDAHVCAGVVEQPRVTDREEGEPTALLPILEEWATSDAAPHRVLALLGSFGAGKTTAAQLFAQRLDALRKTAPSTPLPIYLDFRRLLAVYNDRPEKRLTLAAIIVHCLNPTQTHDIDATRLLEILRRKKAVIIFDGLDEIGTRIGVERAASLYRQLLEIVPADARASDMKEGRADWRLSPLRILVTCRTHFFRDHMEERSTFDGFDRARALPKRKDDQTLRTLYMAPFTPEQIESFLVKTLGEADGREAFATLQRVAELGDLAAKPIMTRYLAELAPDLEEDVAAGRIVNVATVYDHLFRRAIERDKGKRTALTQEDRQTLLERLALHLWQERKPGLSVADLENWFDIHVEQRPGLRQVMAGTDGRAQLHIELRNASLLIRENADVFRFVHTSFGEYFLACALYRALLDKSFATLAPTPPISEETRAFIVDLALTHATQDALADALAGLLENSVAAPGRRLILSVMAEARARGLGVGVPGGADLSDLDLRDLPLGELLGGMVDRVDFARAQMLGAEFRQTRFLRCDFEGAILSQAAFDGCDVVDCRGAPTGLASASARATAGKGSEWLRLHGLTLEFSETVRTRAKSPDRPPPLVVQGHRSAVTSVAVSPDEAFVVTGSYDGTARLWDARSGKELRAFKGHGGAVWSVAVSPDGAFVVTGSFDRTARLWDARSGEELRAFKGHGGAVRSVAVSPDGDFVATGSFDRTARLWETRSGKQLRAFKGHGGPVTSVAFSPDGACVVTGSDDNTARLWEARSGNELRAFKGHGGSVWSVAFSPDGAFIVTGSDDSTARLWDARSGNELRAFKGHGGFVMSVAFSPDGAFVATGSLDATVRLWEARSGKQLRAFMARGAAVWSVAFSPDGACVVSGSLDNTARLWDAGSGKELRAFKGHGETVQSVAFSPDGACVVTGSYDGTARLWDARSGKELRAFMGHGDSVRSVAFSPDGGFVATGSDDNTARLWEARSGKELSALKGHGGPVWSVAVSPDGACVVTGSSDNTARLWEARSGKELRAFKGHGGAVLSVAFSPDGAFVVTVSSDNTARLWEARSGNELRAFKGHGGSVQSVAFSPDGAFVVTGSDDKTARLWEARSGKQIRALKGHRDYVLSVAVSPDGTVVVTGSSDNTARLWEARSGKQIRAFEGHGGAVLSVAFSPDGAFVVTGSNDRTARVWETKSGECLFIRRQFADAWVQLDETDHVLGMSDRGWKYIYGLETDPSGATRVVTPAMPEIVADD